ncbi:flavin-containing monooxygenase FMO GS-OX-like 4 isoform X2 [Wolffia australiana]
MAGHSISSSILLPRWRKNIQGTLQPATTVEMSSLVSPRHVAVIGGGGAGLVAARELRKEGHRVVVFERRRQIGGTWLYDREVESDPLGLDSSREIVHSSLYASLRTNLPRECMGFLDYPFAAKSGEGRDPRRFPGHAEVLRYLEDFAEEFDLVGMVRLGTEVVRVARDELGRWAVRSRRASQEKDEGLTEEVYDGVVVCNGHYTEPRIAEIPGIESWPGKQLHSHSYRIPEPFLDQVVVVIGSSASAVDISRDIAEFAREVHVASRDEVGSGAVKQPGYENFWLHPMIVRAQDDGGVVFQDGTSVRADVILHCTGYKYHFPFLETEKVVTVEDNRVGPLYKHVFPPSLAPWLSFIGLPWKSKWVAAALSGRVTLPDEAAMMDSVRASYCNIEAAGWPKRYTHNLNASQFDYDDWLAAQCGHPPVEEWRKEMYAAASTSRRADPEGYRDRWADAHLVDRSHMDFQALTR